MVKLVRLAVVLAMIGLIVATAAPALADDSVVDPTIKGSEAHGQVTSVPDKSVHPHFDHNPAYAVYGDARAPGKVFWGYDGISSY